MKLTSPAFADDDRIPVDFTKEGANQSPPLHIEGVPAGAKQLALSVIDPDAPTQFPFVHWLLYGIPADVTDLPPGLDDKPRLDTLGGAAQGVNDFKHVGYDGPMPPVGHGPHHYHFTVYALDSELQTKPRLDRQALVAAMQGHILDRADLVATYQRVADLA